MWPFGKEPEKKEEEVPSNYTPGQKILLEDTRPKFQSDISKGSKDLSLKDAWQKITWEDFTLERLTSIPCFRDAGMVGFSSMFVSGSVILLYHKNITRALNWAMGGLMLGSIVGWEQCRMKRKRSFQVAQMAMETVAKKEKPMKHKVEHDPKLLDQWEGRSGTKPSNNSNDKPWYKFW
ncbi:Cytochrome c oxidase assembly protein COX20, mitochondrial [Nakaseomyces bracarensis]|uniref:Cytochrome c oxidase assembly protein COX20, mitochondrial n=1 Tax=Nakaseomyces bracarensis TaxID=273131 RepID=A0ABR4NU87_9SACH